MTRFGELWQDNCPLVLRQKPDQLWEAPFALEHSPRLKIQVFA